jgi:uncharacterized repeat protein (TIGR02543 family)/prepilin-type N-terminal cleavage/methylation domain-containing protein
MYMMNMIVRRRMAQKRGARRAFTLVELIVILAIIAILAGIAIPSLVGYADKADEAEIKQYLATCVKAVQAWASERYADNIIGQNALVTPDASPPGASHPIQPGTYPTISPTQATTWIEIVDEYSKLYLGSLWSIRNVRFDDYNALTHLELYRSDLGQTAVYDVPGRYKDSGEGGEGGGGTGGGGTDPPSPPGGGPVTIYWTVTFDLQYDDLVLTRLVTKGGKATPPDPAPTRVGYRLKGWYKDAAGTSEYDFDTPVNSKLTLYAKWEETPKYTVTFNSMGGSNVSPQTVKKGETADEPSTPPIRTGYVFLGWYTVDGDLYEFNTPVTGDLDLYAYWSEYFEFTIVAADNTFLIPVAGSFSTGTPTEKQRYAWEIAVDDGEYVPYGDAKNTNGININDQLKGSTGTHRIKIRENAATVAENKDHLNTYQWFRAFGFGSGTTGSGRLANKQKVAELVSPLPLRGMCISGDSTSGYNSGTYFGFYMFRGCNGASFKMGKDFTLPQDITVAGSYFGDYMFYQCNGAAFTLEDSAFNLPQNITTVGEYFGIHMFEQCNGAAFTLSGSALTLPPLITSVPNGFCKQMFQDCSGGSFLVNTEFTFPKLSAADLNGPDVFKNTFYVSTTQGTAKQQASGVASRIINGNDKVASDAGITIDRDTFCDDRTQKQWPDYETIPENWR